MRYDLLTMLPEMAFNAIGKRMTLEGGGGGGKAPPAPPPPEPVKPPESISQTPKAPARDPFVAANKTAAATQGPQSTMLTGTGGVAPSSLSLGRASTLYDKSKLGE
jgi:hypothetical protein